MLTYWLTSSFEFVDCYNGNNKPSGKKRLISIRIPASNPNQIVAITGAVERYFVKSCIVILSPKKGLSFFC